MTNALLYHILFFIMKRKLFLISTLFSATALLWGADNQAQFRNLFQTNKKEINFPIAIVSNDTSHDLKMSLQFKDEVTQKVEMITKDVPAESTQDDAVYFNKQGGFTGYPNAEFSIDIIIHRMGIHAAKWTGSFTGRNMRFSHAFEYRAVVQNPTKIMSTVNLQMIVNYQGNTMNIMIVSPEEDTFD